MTRILLFSFLFYTGIVAAQPGKLVNNVVAQVGDNIILLSDLEQQQLQARQSEMDVDYDSRAINDSRIACESGQIR